MSPKKKRSSEAGEQNNKKAKSAAASSGKAVPGDAAVADQRFAAAATEVAETLIMPTMNADHAALVDDAITTILNNPLLENIQEEEALGVETGDKGFMFKFDAEHCKRALETTGQYSCSANMWWMDIRWTCTPGVPINTGSVTELQEHLFSVPPSRFPTAVVIGVLDAGVDLCTSSKGRFRRLSPEEPLHALLFGVSKAVKRGADVDELKQWRQVMLSVQFIFELVPSVESMYWRAQNLREEAVSTYKACKHSALQNTVRVLQFKRKREEISGKLTAEQAGGVVLRSATRQVFACHSVVQHCTNNMCSCLIIIY